MRHSPFPPFRTAIVKLYNHRCALCGIRMLTPDVHTIVEAAHIIPWKESFDDHPTTEKYFWPGQGNFEYHRTQKFLE